MTEDNKFMSLAIHTAQEGMRTGQTPFGACIVNNGKVISCAHNVVWCNNDITAHAEIQAIRGACKELQTINLSGCTMYSTCEPCPMCFSACHWAKIAKIVYGAGIADAQEAGFNELSISSFDMKQMGNSTVEVVKDCMREENKKLFNEWTKNAKSKAY